MSYGLRDLKLKKDTEHLVRPLDQADVVIVGEDTACLLAYFSLLNKGKKVLLVNDRAIVRNDLEAWRSLGIRLFRGEEAINQLTSILPAEAIKEINSPAKFYKDQQWRQFGGRTKNAEMMFAENYFLNKSAEISLEGLFGEDNWAHFDQRLAQGLKIKLISSLIHHTDGWKIECQDNSTIECAQLIWGKSINQFVKLSSAADTYSQAFLEYAHNANRYSVLEVFFTLKKKIYDGNESLFIPQSVSNEEGHFIVEFHSCDEVSKEQTLAALCFVSEDDAQAEELAKKIRHLKRVLERVFPDFSKSITDEKIQFSENILSTNLSTLNKEDLPVGCHFIGTEAPLFRENSSEFSGDWGRSIVSFFSLEQEL